MRSTLILLLLVVVFWSGCGSDGSARDAPSQSTQRQGATKRLAGVERRIDVDEVDYDLLHAAILHETNRSRVLNGLPPLQYSKTLEKAALGHSLDMVEHDFFSHRSVVPGKETMAKRLARVGITRASSGENIADFSVLELESGMPYRPPSADRPYFSAESGEPIPSHTYEGAARVALTQWMNSPGHRENILNREYKYLGVGLVCYRNKEYSNMPYFKATQNFSSVGE